MTDVVVQGGGVSIGIDDGPGATHGIVFGDPGDLAQGVVGVAAQYRNAVFVTFDALSFLGAARQVADRAGDHRHAVALLRQVAGEFVVARAAGFIEGGKGLVDEEDVHKQIVTGYS